MDDHRGGDHLHHHPYLREGNRSVLVGEDGMLECECLLVVVQHRVKSVRDVPVEAFLPEGV